MRATELHTNGTYADISLATPTRDLLVRLADQLGVADPVPPADLHTTLIYSRRPCPRLQEIHGEPFTATGRITGLTTWNTHTGSLCLVALVDCPEMVRLHRQLRQQHGATHDYPDFRPHITLSYAYAGDEPVLPPGDYPVSYEAIRVKPLEPK